MRAQEFINEEAHIPDHFAKRLAKQGYKFLGQGIDQSAFTVPGNPNLVLKIFGHGEWDGNSSHKMFFRWAKFCRKNSNNPFLPKFSGFETVRIDGKNYIMMYQERLKHDSKIGYAVSVIAESAYYSLFKTSGLSKFKDSDQYLDAIGVLKKIGVDYNFLFKTLAQLAKISKSRGYDFDMHINNTMVRPNRQPVIVDPWV